MHVLCYVSMRGTQRTEREEIKEGKSARTRTHGRERRDGSAGGDVIISRQQHSILQKHPAGCCRTTTGQPHTPTSHSRAATGQALSLSRCCPAFNAQSPQSSRCFACTFTGPKTRTRPHARAWGLAAWLGLLPKTKKQTFSFGCHPTTHPTKCPMEEDERMPCKNRCLPAWLLLLELIDRSIENHEYIFHLLTCQHYVRTKLETFLEN